MALEILTSVLGVQNGSQSPVSQLSSKAREKLAPTDTPVEHNGLSESTLDAS